MKRNNQTIPFAVYFTDYQITKMKKARYRTIQLSDNEKVAEIIRAAFIELDAPTKGTVYSDPTTDNLFELFQRENSRLWIAELDNCIVGCGGIYPTKGLPDDCVEIVKLYLNRSARGKGIGKELLEKSIKSAEEFGFKQLYIESTPAFDNAIHLYQKMGFTRLKQPLGQTGHDGCNIWMHKFI